MTYTRLITSSHTEGGGNSEGLVSSQGHGYVGVEERGSRDNHLIKFFVRKI